RMDRCLATVWKSSRSDIASKFGDRTKPFIRAVMRSFSAFQSDATFYAASTISAHTGFHMIHGDQFGIGRIRASVSSFDIWVNSSKAMPSDSCQKRPWMSLRNSDEHGADSNTPSNGNGQISFRS